MATDIRQKELTDWGDEFPSVKTLLPLLKEYTDKVRDGYVRLMRGYWTNLVLRLGLVLFLASVGIVAAFTGYAFAVPVAVLGCVVAVGLTGFPESVMLYKSFRAQSAYLKRLIQDGSQLLEHSTVADDEAVELRGRKREADAVYIAAQKLIEEKEPRYS